MQQSGRNNQLIAILLRPFNLFLIYSVLILSIYHQTIGARLVTDALNWIMAYEAQGITGIADSFGDSSQHYFYHLIFFGMYSLFGTQETGYYIVYSLLHAVNAALLFVVLRNYLDKLATGKIPFVAFCASILFLLNPYQTETVVWGATIHYLLLTGIFLLIWKLQLKDYIHYNIKIQICSWLLFLFAVYLHIIAITIPIILFLILLPLNAYSFRKSFLRLLPFFGIVFIYIITNYFILGSITGHKAVYTETSAGFIEILANLIRYIAKDFFLVHYLPYSIRDGIYSFANNNISIICISVIMLISLYIYLSKSKVSTYVWLVITFFLAFCIALIPSLTLYFYYLTPIEADRLTYFALLFSSVLISILIFILSNKAAFILSTICVIIYIIVLFKNISAWNDAAKIATILETSFPPHGTGNLFLLNIPDNIRGAYLYRESKGESKYAQALDFKKNKPLRHVNEIMQFNMQKVTDGVDVEVIDSATLKIKFAQYGNWWWLEGKGASDYTDETKTVTITDNGMAYIVHFKSKKADDTFVYLNNNQWHKVENF